jgi:hypothetical protein
VRRVDRNQPEIVAGLRRLPGCSVHVTSTVADGFPDLVVGYKDRNYLFEIKDPEKPPSARILTPAQTKFVAGWRGQIDVVHDLGECLRFMKATGRTR